MAQKKGQMAAFLEGNVIPMVFAGIVIAAFTLALVSIQSSGSFTGASAGVIGNLLSFVLNVVAQLPTAGTLVGVTLIILAVVGIGIYGYRRLNNE